MTGTIVPSRTFIIDSECWYSNLAMPAGAEESISIAYSAVQPALVGARFALILSVLAFVVSALALAVAVSR